MVNIKKFIDRVSGLDVNPGKQLILPAHEARLLRDEIIKLMADKLELYQKSQQTDSVIEVQVVGGKF